MRNKKRFLSLMLVLGILASYVMTPLSANAETSTEPSTEPNVDSRAYMHGVNLVQVGDKSLLVFSSNKYPTTLPTGEWMHDIYYSWINPSDPQGSMDVQTLVNDNTAQEPASVAVNKNGVIAVTAEDAQFSENLDQTYGIWNSDLSVKKDYGVQLMNPNGGHSGHIAASGDKFLTTFCDGWIDGGGVDNLGTGDDLYYTIINEDGSKGVLMETKVDPNSRDWWPVVAGADTTASNPDSNWLQVWQKYGTAGEGGGTVWGAITTTDGIQTPFQITDNNKYYYYDVCYVPSIQRYLVTGSRMDGGFAALIDKNGNIKDIETELPFTGREVRTITRQVGNKVVAVYPALPNGFAVMNIENDSITLDKIISGDVNWDYMGTDGMFTSDTTAFFATGTKDGIKFVNVDLNNTNTGTVNSKLTGFSSKLNDPSASPVIAFLGDSITEKNDHTGNKENYVDYLSEMFKNINPNASVINAGVSSDTTELALERLQTDVLDKKPDVTFIMLGVNDGSSWYPDVTVDEFSENYKNIIEQLVASGSEVILVTQNDVQDNAYHGTVTFEKLSAIESKIAQIANEKGLPIIDCYTNWVNLKANNPNLFKSLFSDSVHPNETGHIYYFSQMRSALIKLLALPNTTWGYTLIIDENANVKDETTDDYSFLENLALNKAAVASEEYDAEFAASMAVDGDYNTRWDSLEGTDCKEPVSFTVDLGDVYNIKKVVISWDASASEYNLLTSIDGVTYEKAYSTVEGGIEADDIVSVSGQARYVRFEGIKRSTEWGYSFTEFAVYGSKPFETKVAKWLNNKSAAYTVGFAGGFEKSLNIIKPLMEQYGIKGTAYINSANVGSSEMATWDEYKALAQNGTLQLGYFGPGFKTHFVEKDGTWSEGMSATTASAIIADGKTLIETSTGYPCEVMAGNDYFTNNNDDLTNIMKNNFLATMAGDGFSPYNAWKTTDYYKLGGFVMYPNMGWGGGDSAADMNAAVDEAIKNNSLLSIEGRGVFDEKDYPFTPSEKYPTFTDMYRDLWAPSSDFTDWWLPTPLSWYKSNFEYVQSKSNQLWVDSLANITKYMKERDNATFKVKEFTNASGTISMSLPDEMVSQTNTTGGGITTTGSSIFVQELTLNTAVPNDWASATVKQGNGESSTPIIPFTKDGKKWISYNAVPGNGDISISIGTRGSYDSLGKVEGKVTKGIVNVASDHKKILDGEVFVLELTNATLRDELPEKSILIDNLPEGFTYEVTRLDANKIQIKLNGSAKSMITRSVNLTAVIKGKCVNELEATDSVSLNLQIVGSLSAIGESEITPWKNNKTAAFTATYDDGIINSLRKLETLHLKYGIPATIALAPTFIDDKKHPDDGFYGPVSMGSWDDFRELLKSGVFEVSSHMMNHAMSGTSGNYQGRGVEDFLIEEGAVALEKDFADSKARLEKELGVPCDTIIYPHYDTNDEINAIAEKVFVAARTGGDEYDGNSPDGTNYYNLYSKTFFDKPNAGADHDTTAAEAKKWLDTAIQKGTWLITVGHGTDYEGWGAPPVATYEGLYAYIAENKDTIWADTLANISKYMKERNSSSITTVSSKDGFTITLADTLDNTLYNQELTLKTKVDSSWNNIRVTKNGNAIAFTTTNDELGKYVYYNVLPDSGTVTVDNNGTPSETLGGASISPNTASFDKKISNQTDVNTTITWNDATSVKAVTRNGVSIGLEAYTVNGSTLTIKKEYLAQQAIGNIGLSIEFDKGNAVIFTVVITDTTSTGGGSTGGSTGGSSSGSSQSTKTTVVNGRITTSIPLVDQNTKTATVLIEKDIIVDTLSKFDKVIIDIPKAEKADKYNIKLPEQVFNSKDEVKKVTLNTEYGSLQIPTNMLSNLGYSATDNVTLSIGRANIDNLSADKKAAIGGRPVVELKIQVDGKDIVWNNSDVQVLVSIPYSLAENEKNEAEFIIAWYIDGNGEVQPVTTSSYDSKSGMLSFMTSHFSKYAVTIVHKSFDDLSNYKWAKKQFEVLTSKGIMESYGTSAMPQKDITRAEFIAYLVKGLGLNASLLGNFVDVDKANPYYNEIGVAKKLGITSGTGNNRFDCDNILSRQDMMVLVNNALKIKEGALDNANTDVLAKFKDVGKIAGYASQSIANLVSRGIVSGSGSSMEPKSLTTRAHAAAVIYNLIK